MKKKLLLLLMLIVTSVTSWAAEPYFEVLSGSFATKDAEVKVTFPGVTTVELKESLSVYDGSTYLTAVFDDEFAVNGNEITFTLKPSAYYIAEPGDNPLSIRLVFLGSNLFLDGEGTFTEVYSKELLPYSEVIDGSLESGNVTVKVTAPKASSITLYSMSYPQYYYMALRHNGMELAKLYLDNPNLTLEGNTVSGVFSYTPTEDNNPANYDVYFTQYTFRLDNQWDDDEAVIPFKYDPTPAPSACTHENLTRHDAVESTDLVQGNDAYDQCDECGACFATDDTEHENVLTAADFTLPLDEEPINYFYIKNIDDIETQVIWSLDHVNLQYSYDMIDWYASTGVDPLPANGRIYYRAPESGNTFFGGYDAWRGFSVGYRSYTEPYTDSRCHYFVGGDITTLLRSNGKVKTLPEPTYVEEWNGEGYEPVLRGVFENFFRGDTYGYLTGIFDLVLPSTTLTERCYMNMFATNPGITAQGPKISAVTMAPHSCESMFHGTEGLSWLPAMDVETMAEYSCAYMFAGCTELASVMMSPTTVAPHCCEMMFYDCRNLQSAPSLPATTLAEDCYKSMFYNCSSLQYVSELPAPYLVDGCYVQMFYGCINLQALSVGMQTEWPVRVTYNEVGGYNEYDYYCTRDWVVGVNTYGGTFTGNPSLFKNVYPGDALYSTIPQNWTSSRRLHIDVNIGPAGYTTFCYDYNWEIPMGTEGYVGYVDESGEFHFEKAYGPRDIVQSTRRRYSTYVDGVGYVDQWVCKAVVLKGNPGSYNAILTEDDAEDVYDLDDPKAKNQLLGTMYDYDTSLYRSWDDDYYGMTDDDYYFYALSLDENGENVGFYWMEDDGAPFVTRPYKAFLRARKDFFASNGNKDAFVFDEAIATGVAPIATGAQQSTIYDLSGRSLQHAGKGLYIINGRKVVK